MKVLLHWGKLSRPFPSDNSRDKAEEGSFNIDNFSLSLVDRTIEQDLNSQKCSCYKSI